MMSLRTVGLIARVGLALSGVVVAGLTAVGLSPVSCTRGVGQALMGQTSRPALFRAMPTDTVRASKLWRIVNAKPKLVVLPAVAGLVARPAWQLVKVVRVVDADTYEVQAGAVLSHVRVLHVDAPEHDQPFGQQATDSVRALVLGKYVLVLSAGSDQYGRTLAQVKLRPVAFSGRPGLLLDSLLVVRGWAWAYALSKQPVVLASQQQQAVAAGRGLWKCGTTRVVRPGIWRAYNAQDKASAWAGCPW